VLIELDKPAGIRLYYFYRIIRRAIIHNHYLEVFVVGGKGSIEALTYSCTPVIAWDDNEIYLSMM
jgi:hypothetical protein